MLLFCRIVVLGIWHLFIRSTRTESHPDILALVLLRELIFCIGLVLSCPVPSRPILPCSHFAKVKSSSYIGDSGVWLIISKVANSSSFLYFSKNLTNIVTPFSVGCALIFLHLVIWRSVRKCSEPCEVQSRSPCSLPAFSFHLLLYASLCLTNNRSFNGLQ